MQKNLGTFKHNEVVEHTFITSKPIMAAVGSCDCLSVRVYEHGVTFKWKMPEFPFQIRKDILPIQQAIEVTYKDYTKEIFTFEVNLLR